MTDYYQGDIIKMRGFRNSFLILSNNAFIQATGMFHVCPILKGIDQGPLHIEISGVNHTSGTAICEQIKLIDPGSRPCHKEDYLNYASKINISDAVQGIFDYD